MAGVKHFSSGRYTHFYPIAYIHAILSRQYIWCWRCHGDDCDGPGLTWCPLVFISFSGHWFDAFYLPSYTPAPLHRLLLPIILITLLSLSLLFSFSSSLIAYSYKKEGGTGRAKLFLLFFYISIDFAFILLLPLSTPAAHAVLLYNIFYYII